jgi:hypothetical protein
MATPTNLPASFTTGAVLTAAQMNDLRGAFRILQVVTGETTTETSTSSTTHVDTTLTATITPQSSSSKILVYVSHPNCFKGNGNTLNSINFRLVRGSTNIYTFNSFLGFTGSASEMYFSANAIHLDSPATTSATTYKTTFANEVAASQVKVQQINIGSRILLMEVSA